MFNLHWLIDLDRYISPITSLGWLIDLDRHISPITSISWLIDLDRHISPITSISWLIDLDRHISPITSISWLIDLDRHISPISSISWLIDLDRHILPIRPVRLQWACGCGRPSILTLAVYSNLQRQGVLCRLIKISMAIFLLIYWMNFNDTRNKFNLDNDSYKKMKVSFQEKFFLFSFDWFVCFDWILYFGSFQFERLFVFYN